MHKDQRSRLRRLVAPVVMGGSVLPVTVTPAGLADGALPAPFIANAAWAVSSGAIVGTPTLGSELLTNGNFETWSSATDAGTWSEGVAGTSTVNREGTVVNAGSYAARLDMDASNSLCYMYQTPSLTLGDWFRFSVYAKSDPASKNIRLEANNQVPPSVYHTVTDTYAQYRNVRIYRQASGFNVQLRNGTNTASSSQYYDDASVKKLTLSTLATLVNGRRADVTVKAGWTIPIIGEMAGVIISADATLTNYVVFAANRATGTCHLIKIVGSTITQVAAQAFTYSAGKNVEIRKSGTTYQMFYNGSQIGTDQTISDAALISNTYHGLFSTASEASCSYFFVG